MSFLQRYSYLIRSAINYGSDKSCPYCQSVAVKVIDRKYIVTRLLECANCNLMFRHPKDNVNHSHNFYKYLYKQEGITTDLPDTDTLEQLKSTNFKNTIRSVEPVKDVLQALTGTIQGKKILDYGCSWGYMIWQFSKLGMDVQGYEIGADRVKFGNEVLQVPIVSDENLIEDNFDIIFSSHVIEHLPDIKAFTTLCFKKLKPNGLLVILCPNASTDLRKTSPGNFHHFWGEIHPNMVSAAFYQNIFNGYPYFISSSPYDLDKIAAWNQSAPTVYLNNGNELMCIVKNTRA